MIIDKITPYVDYWLNLLEIASLELSNQNSLKVSAPTNRIKY